MYDLADYPFIERFIKASIEKTQDELPGQSSKGGISTKSSFQVAIAMLILLNTLFVYIEQSVKDEEQDEKWNAWLITEIVFQTAFTIEFIIKFIDLRIRYFCDAWNLFDLILVCVGIAGIVISIMSTTESSGNAVGQARLVKVAQIFRVLRILRLFRLVRFFQVLRARMK